MVKKFLLISNKILMFLLAAQDQEYPWNVANPTLIAQRFPDQTWWHTVSSPLFFSLIGKNAAEKGEKICLFGTS